MTSFKNFHFPGNTHFPGNNNTRKPIGISNKVQHKPASKVRARNFGFKKKKRRLYLLHLISVFLHRIQNNRVSAYTRLRFCHDVAHYLFTKMTEESFLSILLYFSLLHDLFSMYCWCSNGVLLPLKVSMFTEFVFNFGSCLSLKIFKCRNSPVCSVSPKMD